MDGLKMNGQPLPETVKSGSKVSGNNVSFKLGSGSYSFNYLMMNIK